MPDLNTVKHQEEEDTMDRKIFISVGSNRWSKKWVNQETTFEELDKRLSETIRTSELVNEYQKFEGDARVDIKDKGGFVGGFINGPERKKEAIKFRSLLTYDLDDPEVDFLDRYKKESKYKTIVYSTHSHTPEKPRLRFIIPLTRDVNPDEYIAISRLFAGELGINQFDKCSFRINQLMYWPTTPKDGNSFMS